MPLRDHFHPPLSERLPWPTLHSSWATRIADALNERWLPEDFIAAEHTPSSRLEIDIATFERAGHVPPTSPGAGGTATLPVTWTPPEAACSIPGAFNETTEVRVYSTVGGMTLVAAIELISPGNKDREASRRAFASKVTAMLGNGVAVTIIDIVTERRANLHHEILDLLPDVTEGRLDQAAELYAVSYRPLLRDEVPEIELWTEPCVLGESLPTMPLRLVRDEFVPVEFEPTYEETCRRRRIV